MQTSINSSGKQSIQPMGPVNCVGTTGTLERPRYFPRQLITPDDLTLEATYFRKRLRLHNRHLHGWGVVCGAAVCPVENPGSPGSAWAWHVKITPGYILGPYGDDIVIDCEYIVDLRICGAVGVAGEYYSETYDPWCTEVIADDVPDTVYVAVQYKEVMARQVRVQPVGCGCDDAHCEYSRWQDGYEVGILTECPPSHQRTGKAGAGRWVECPPVGEEDEDARSPGGPPCLPCPSSPWVVLAKVCIDAEGHINADHIDNRSCRRIVTCSAYFCPDDYDYGVRPDYSRPEAVQQRTPAVERAPMMVAENRGELRVRLRAEQLLVQSAIEGLDWSAPDIGARLGQLSAHTLHGVGPGSTLGRWLEGATISDVASMSYAEVRPDDAEEIEVEARMEPQFNQIALKASRIMSLIARLQERG